MTIYQRLWDFQSGTRISSQQVDDEFNQVIAALNQHNTDIANAQTAAINFAKGFGLGDVAKDIASTDLNTLDVSGFYKGTGLTNAPTASNAGYIINVKSSATDRLQVFYSPSTKRIFVRFQITNTWGTWDEITSKSIGTRIDNIGGVPLKMNSSGTVVTMSTPLDQCPNGWLMLWNNVSDGGQQKYVPIYKNETTASVVQYDVGNPTLGVYTSKMLNKTNTTLIGHSLNNYVEGEKRQLAQVLIF